MPRQELFDPKQMCFGGGSTHEARAERRARGAPCSTVGLDAHEGDAPDDVGADLAARDLVRDVCVHLPDLNDVWREEVDLAVELPPQDVSGARHAGTTAVPVTAFVSRHARLHHDEELVPTHRQDVAGLGHRHHRIK